jgi:hypothetical protein
MRRSSVSGWGWPTVWLGGRTSGGRSRSREVLELVRSDPIMDALTAIGLYDLDVVCECSKTAEFILPSVASSSVVSALSMLPLPSF